MRLDEIRLFGDRILVRPDPKEAQSEGGLFIPETVLADNPNFYYVTGTVVALGDGYREDIYECANAQCRYQARRTAGEYCPVCKATQVLAHVGERRPFEVRVGDRVHFGRFAGKQIELTLNWLGPIETTVIDGHLVDVRSGMINDKAKYLIMREVEVQGIVTDNARVTPGYEAARWNKPTKGLTPIVAG